MKAKHQKHYQYMGNLVKQAIKPMRNICQGYLIWEALSALLGSVGNILKDMDITPLYLGEDLAESVSRTSVICRTVEHIVYHVIMQHTAMDCVEFIVLSVQYIRSTT